MASAVRSGAGGMLTEKGLERKLWTELGWMDTREANKPCGLVIKVEESF